MTKAADESDARAREFLDTAPRCTVCGRQIATRGRTRHFLCDPTAMEGKTCSCPSGCSDTHWGNGRAACDPQCVPCKVMAGKRLRSAKDKT